MLQACPQGTPCSTAEAQPASNTLLPVQESSKGVDAARSAVHRSNTSRSAFQLEAQPGFLAGGQLRDYQLLGLNWMTNAWLQVSVVWGCEWCGWVRCVCLGQQREGGKHTLPRVVAHPSCACACATPHGAEGAGCTHHLCTRHTVTWLG